MGKVEKGARLSVYMCCIWKGQKTGECLEFCMKKGGEDRVPIRSRARTHFDVCYLMVLEFKELTLLQSGFEKQTSKLFHYKCSEAVISL